MFTGEGKTIGEYVKMVYVVYTGEGNSERQ